MVEEDMRPQAAVFTAMLESYLKQGQVEEAVQSFEQLRAQLKSGKHRNFTTELLEESRIAFLRSLCRLAREPEATHIYMQAKIDCSVSSIDSTTGMMLARVQSDVGNLSQAWTTMEDMATLGNRPMETTIHSFLTACLKQSECRYTKLMFQRVGLFGMSLSQASYALFIKLHGLNNEIQDALAVYEFMTVKQGIDPSPATACCIMRVCFQCQHPEKAFAILEEMKTKGLVDSDVFRTAICGAASAGNVQRGVELTEEAKNNGFAIPTEAIEFLSAGANRLPLHQAP
jgi:pentatricopeptide repeat protein